jgi:hypothetical protein
MKGWLVNTLRLFGSFFVLSLGSYGCSRSNAEPDGGLRVIEDAPANRDGGIGKDARIYDSGTLDASPRDYGVYDAGGCGCSYGFQQQCAEDEFCGAGFVDEPQCARTDPFGGAEEGGCTQDVAHDYRAGAGCNATCVSTLRGSPCSEIEQRSFVSEMINAWWLAIYAAATHKDAPSYVSMDEKLMYSAHDDWIRFRRCNFFIQRTVFAAAALCRDGFVVVPEIGALHVDTRWMFQRTDTKDSCQDSVKLCIQALAFGARFPDDNPTDIVDTIPALCPNGLPYGAPCKGPDAHRCLKARLASMIRALNPRP